MIRGGVLGFSASPRKNSNSQVILKRILQSASEKGAKTELHNLGKMKIKACLGCEKCRGQGRCLGLRDDMTPVYDKIVESNGLVLVTPVHQYNVSVSMKAFIDRLYAFYDFSDTRPRSWSSRLASMGKKAVLGIVGEQTSEYDMGFAMEAMERPVKALGIEVVGSLVVMETFDAAAVSDNAQAMKRCDQLGGDLFAAISE